MKINKATRLDKLAIEKYRLIKKFKIKESDFTAEFLRDWKGKEYILDNILYYTGKVVEHNDDQYLDNMKQRKTYIDELVKVFGFKKLFDFNTSVTKDADMEQQMRKSKFLQWDKYVKIMMCFNKRMYRTKEDSKFSINAFILLSNALFSEYGIELSFSRYQVRIDKKRKWLYDYKLSLNRIGIKHLANTKKTIKK